MQENSRGITIPFNMAWNSIIRLFSCFIWTFFPLATFFSSKWYETSCAQVNCKPILSSKSALLVRFHFCPYAQKSSDGTASVLTWHCFPYKYCTKKPQNIMLILHLSVTALILEDSWISFGNIEQQLPWPKICSYRTRKEYFKNTFKLDSKWSLH